MRVFITGGAGFIGTHLTKRLRARGDEVSIIDLASPREEERIDIRSRDEVFHAIREFRPDSVIHLAAVASVVRSEEDPITCFTTNVSGTTWVVQASHEVKSHFVLASSAAVYGRVDETPLTTSSPLKPENTYGVSKLVSEAVTSFTSPAATVFRIFNAYGPGCNASYVIPDLIKKFRTSTTSIALQGTGEEKRDFVYISDLLDCFERAIDERTTGTFNLGTGNITSMREVAEQIATIMNKPGLSLKFEGARKGDFPVTRASVGPGSSYPGWRPKIGLREGLGLTIAEGQA